MNNRYAAYYRVSTQMQANAVVLVAKLDRLSRDLHFITTSWAQRRLHRDRSKRQAHH